jgi:peptide/nickel transport system permease protein
MYALMLRRLLVIPLLLLLVSIVAFMFPYFTGTDPTGPILRSRIGEREQTPEIVAAIRADLGLDQPLPIQYVKWLAHIVKGDLGTSFVSQAPVGEILFRGLKVTLILSLVSLAFAVIVSLPLGVVSALRPGKGLDNLIATITQTGVAIPEYWFAPVMILIFCLKLGWLPSAGWRGPLYIILPALTLALRPISYFTRLTRETMIEVMQKDYIRAARAKGLSENRIIWHHALRNSLIPVVTLISLWLAGLLGGSVIVEVIFAVPGIGRVLYDAVIANDLPVVQTGVVLITALAIVINTLTDMSYIVLNPAIRLSNSSR